MKTVLFCGGLGTRIREYSESIPKPMIPIADRPILWHLMNYYGQFGYKDFVLCLGYKANIIKEFFLNTGPRPTPTVLAADRDRPTPGLQARGLLTPHGYVEGQTGP
jgi:NDP-sugar pyrophosphorylase family protein